MQHDRMAESPYCRKLLAPVGAFCNTVMLHLLFQHNRSVYSTPMDASNSVDPDQGTPAVGRVPDKMRKMNFNLRLLL